MENTALTIQENTPASMIMQAVQSGADLEKLEKLLDLQIKWEQNEAKKAYHKAMASFKANPPDIDKDKKVSFQTSKGLNEYNHASLANVCKKISSALSEHGLSASWRTNQTDGTIKVTCTITHELGHSESTSLDAAPDTSGSKNAIQAIGSTISYLERYTVLALTGLATTDMDNDAMNPDQVVSNEQATEIDKLLRDSEADAVKFLDYFDAEKIQDIKANKYNEAVKFLKAKIANRKKNANN